MTKDRGNPGPIQIKLMLVHRLVLLVFATAIYEANATPLRFRGTGPVLKEIIHLSLA